MTPEERPARRLRDVATICDAVLHVPGSPMRCGLDAGHDGKHASGCTRWAADVPCLRSEEHGRHEHWAGDFVRECGGHR